MHQQLLTIFSQRWQNGAYYLLEEERKSFAAEKVSDEENYILTIAAIAKELQAKNVTYAKLHLAVGLPLTWVKSQNEFVIMAINDYYDRHLQKRDDPYLETREKEGLSAITG